MTCTLSAFVPDVRRILRDNAAGASGSYYYTDAQICAGIVDAFRHLNSVRPESRYNENCELVDLDYPSETSSNITTFSVYFCDEWRLGLIYFAAARCYEADIKDTVHQQLAKDLFLKAEQNFAD